MHLVAQGPTPDTAVFDDSLASGHLLVALVEDRVIGFVRLVVLDAGLHVEQVTVAPAFGRRGVGRRLMRAAEHLARQRGFDRLTMTTFRDVPFNGPFYTSLGWKALPEGSLSPGLRCARQEEIDAGLDAWPRLAMVRDV